MVPAGRPAALARLRLRSWRTPLAALAVLFACFSSRPSQAITCTWNGSGGSGGNAWSQSDRWTASGGGAGVCPPGAADSAVFNTGSVACALDANVSVATFAINTGYTGTVTQNSGTTMTVSGTFTQDAGTFTGGDSIINVWGVFTLSGGTFTSTSAALALTNDFTQTGGTFSHNGGQLLMSSTVGKTFASNSSTFNNLTINDGLVGHWRLDDASGTSTSDGSGYGNTGTLGNGTAWVTSGASLPTLSFSDPAGLSFDGVDDNVSLGVSNLPGANANQTIALWVKASAASSQQAFASLLGSGSAIQLGIKSVASVWSVAAWRADGTVLVSTSAASFAGAWHHVAYTLAGTTHTLYIDGTAVANTATPNSQAVTQAWLGAGSGGTQDLFAGSLDDVRVYKRALSAAQISQLAAGTDPAFSNATLALTGSPTVVGDLRIVAGTLAPGSNSITVANNWLNYGVFTAGTGTVTFNGSSAGKTIRANGSSFYNLTVAGSGAGAWAFSDTSAVVGGSLAISGGALTAPSGLLEVQGAFNKTAGTFTHNSGQVMLSSTSTQTFASNSATFNDLYINDGLIGYWKFDEASGPSTDSSGYGRSATWNGSTSTSTGTKATGIIFTNDRSAYFGTASTDDAHFTSPAATKITVSAWIYQDSEPNNAPRVFDFPGYLMLVYPNSDATVANRRKIHFQALRSPTGQWRADTTTISLNTWYHVAVTYDGTTSTNVPTIYINGTSQALTTLQAPGGSQTSNSGTGYFGNRSDNARVFGGYIDDFRMYNRVLTAAEIQSLAIGRQPGSSVATQNLTGTPAIAGDLVIASGLLSIGSNAITVGGSWWNYGGIFRAGAAGGVTFNGSSSGKYIRSGGHIFQDVTINGTGSWTLADDIELERNKTLYMTAGTLDLSSRTFRGGQIDKTVNITPSTSTVVLDSTASKSIKTSTYNNLRIEIPETSLIGYWKFDQGEGPLAWDYAATQHQGTLTNGPLWANSGLPSTIEFVNQGAIQLDGTDDYIDVSNPVVDTSAAFSACAWVNFTAPSAYDTIVSVNGTNISGFYLQRTSAGYFAFTMYPSDSTGATISTAGSTTMPANGTWYHVCGVFTGTQPKLYVNGTLEGTGSTLGTTWAATGHAIIGAALWSAARVDYVSGKVDDVRLYNVALTAAQVASLAGGRYTGLTTPATYTVSTNNTAVSGTFNLDSGTYSNGALTTTMTGAGYVNTGTYVVATGTTAVNSSFTVRNLGTLDLTTSGGRVALANGTSLVMDGTLNGASTNAIIQNSSGGAAGAYYSFTVGSTASATPTLNISGLKVLNTDSNGMYINAAAGSATTFTSFNNIIFGTGTGNYLLRIYSPSLALHANGLTFDASTTYNMKLAGNGTGDGETRAYLGASCTNSPCESYDVDDDSEPDGTGDTGNGTGDEAVVQWMHDAYNDTAGAIQGFPTTAFDWNTFTYWNTYVAYRDFSGSTDRLFARDTDGAYLNASGGAGYSWDLPSSVGDIIGTPRWTQEGISPAAVTHYVYVLTTLGYLYKLSDSGTAFTLVTAQAWPYRNGASATATSALAMDTNNVYWAGNDGAGARKMFSLTTAMVLNGTRTVVADVVASPALATVSSVDYLFTATNGRIYRTPTSVSSEVTSTQSTSTVYGRVVVFGNAVYFPEDVGKIWSLSPADLSTSWSYQDTNVGRHASGCAADSACTVRSLYYDPALARLYFGDKDGHLYALTYQGAAVANFPYRPGLSTDEFQTAPLHRAGVIVIGSTTGKVFVIDQDNGSTGPAVYQTFNFQSAISSISYDTDGYYVVGTASGKLYYLNGVSDPTPGST